MNRVAARGGIVFVLVLLLLVGIAFFVVEYMAKADNWIVAVGSPHVYNGSSSNIGCGVVADRDGVILLDVRDSRKYSGSQALRMATVHWVGDRQTKVAAPAFAPYAAQMADFQLFGGVYNYGGNDSVGRLTLSAEVQKVALEAMGDRKGTIGVYNYKTGEIICAISTPSFDPDHVPDVEADPQKYDAIFRNRFTQSNYSPGSVFKIVTLAAALETIPDVEEQTFTCTGSIEFGTNGVDKVICSGKHGKQSLKKAFRNSCNCAFAELALQLGADTLTRYAEQFGVTGSITFDGISTKEGNFDLSQASSVEVAWSGIGQYTNLVNPCGYMTFMGAIASGGKGVIPHIVQGIDVGGEPSYTAKAESGKRIMSEETAQTVREYMAANVKEKYDKNNEAFPGLTVCAKTGTAEIGKDVEPHAVFSGFVADEEYPFAFFVIVENGGGGEKTCKPIIKEVLAACKKMTDQS